MARYPAHEDVLSLNGTTLAQVMDFGLPGSSKKTIDATAYGDSMMQFVLDIAEGDEVDLELAYDPEDASHAALQAAYATGVDQNFNLSNEEAEFDVDFTALITALGGPGGTRSGLVQLKCSIKLTSLITEAS